MHVFPHVHKPCVDNALLERSRSIPTLYPRHFRRSIKFFRPPSQRAIRRKRAIIAVEQTVAVLELYPTSWLKRTECLLVQPWPVPDRPDEVADVDEVEVGIWKWPVGLYVVNLEVEVFWHVDGLDGGEVIAEYFSSRKETSGRVSFMDIAIGGGMILCDVNCPHPWCESVCVSPVKSSARKPYRCPSRRLVSSS